MSIVVPTRLVSVMMHVLFDVGATHVGVAEILGLALVQIEYVDPC